METCQSVSSCSKRSASTFPHFSDPASYSSPLTHHVDWPLVSCRHLPGYLVASFIKRMARLALHAPPAGARLCIVFIGNLMVRHPSCTVLAHRPDCTVDKDPFLADVDDPAKTCAMDSSLWEIKVCWASFRLLYCGNIAQVHIHSIF